MLRPIDQYYLNQVEPFKSCLQALRLRILGFDKNIIEKWHYGMPFFYYKEYRCCYLWVHKKRQQPYIGVVDGNYVRFPDLLAEKRSRMKIFLVKPEQDLPLKKIDLLMKAIIKLYDE